MKNGKLDEQIYMIVDREGKILNENANSYSFETDLKEILELEKTEATN